MSMSRRIKFRIFTLFISLLLTASLFTTAVSASTPYDLPSGTTVSALSALLVSLGPTQEEDVILYDKDADKERSPAALVRLMVGCTAIRIIQENNIDIDTATGTYTVASFNKYISGTGIGVAQMNYGEVWTVRDLLSVSMIHSAADACVTLAETLSGSVEQFVAQMNALAAEIGCTDTNFSNVTGLDSIFQYTTANDVYRMMRYGMNSSEFVDMLSATNYDVKPVSGGSETTLVTTNNMLKTSSTFYYTPMKFGRNGSSDGAGLCLASVAQDSGYEYLCVVLGSPLSEKTAQFTDTKTLYKWAFKNFAYKTLLDENDPVAQLKVNLAWNKDTVTLIPEKSFATTVTNELTKNTVIKKVTLYSDSVDAPVAKGQVYGKVELYISVDQKIGEVNLVASESVERSEALAVWSKINQFLTSPWFYAGLVLLVLLLIGYVILNIVHNQKRKRMRMKRVKKYR